MDTLAKTFGLPAGYSDHTKCFIVSCAAAARGATVIEMHFTLDCSMDDPDHSANPEPHELKQLVDFERTIEVALG